MAKNLKAKSQEPKTRVPITNFLIRVFSRSFAAEKTTPGSCSSRVFFVNNYWMVSVTVVEWLKLPLVPVMVSVRFPTPALLPTFTVSVEVPEPVTEVGLKLALTRDPNPLTLRPTVPVNPFTAVMVTVY